MTDVLGSAVQVLEDRLRDRGFDGCVRIVVSDQGVLTISPAGVAVGDDGTPEATLTASSETFARMFRGKLGPMQAYMSGRLSIEGDMGAAVRLGKALA